MVATGRGRALTVGGKKLTVGRGDR
jgi:hypothetical protein